MGWFAVPAHRVRAVLILLVALLAVWLLVKAWAALVPFSWAWC